MNKREELMYRVIVVYMMTAFGLTFANIFVTSMPKIGPAMLLLAPVVLFVIYLVELSLEIRDAMKEDKGL